VTGTGRRNESRLPAPEVELALLLIGTRRRRERAAGRIAELAARVDQDALAAVLTEQRVLVLAGTRLVETHPVAVTTLFRQRLDGATTVARARALGFSAVTGSIVEALERASIQAVALKGPALAGELYGDEALRDYADVDILVALADLDRAAAVTRALGWTEADPSAGKLPRLHRLLHHPDGCLPVVELHWRIHWYEARFAQVLLDRSRVCDGLRQLHYLDQLAALLLFYARDGFAGLRYAADIAAWWDRHGSPAVPARLEGLMAEHPALAAPWCAALVAAVGVGGLPDEAALAGCRARSRRSQIAARLANWDLNGDADQIQANIALMDGLLAPQRGLGAFLRRQLFWPPGSAATSASLAPEARAHALALGGVHATKMVVRYLLAIWHLRCGRSWSPLPPSVTARSNATGRDP
jgi:putative nucleotidyltransferase-like protein